MVDPPGTAALLIDRHGFAEGLVSFGTLCGVQSSLVRFTPNHVITSTVAGTVRNSVFEPCVILS